MEEHGHATASRSIDTGSGELLCEIAERVATITLNRPQAKNSLSDDLTPALRRMIRQCGDDADVGALLITGAGDAFCAGGNVKGMEGDTGDYIPSVYEVQDTVFKQSLICSFIKADVSVLLINSTANSKKTAHS